MKKPKKAKGPVLLCGNYISRSDGAVFVRLGEATVYFSDNKLIAIIQDDVMYRDAGETSGHAYRRIHAAMQRQPCKLQKNINKAELQSMVEVAIMLLASRLVNEKLGITIG